MPALMPYEVGYGIVERLACNFVIKQDVPDHVGNSLQPFRFMVMLGPKITDVPGPKSRPLAPAAREPRPGRQD